MNFTDLRPKLLSLDLETTHNGKIFAIGAVHGDRVFQRSGSFNQLSALKQLDQFAADADFMLGHNLLRHDFPCLTAVAPKLKLLQKPVVDTLLLSPLAFPENPYHRLVKDYKLVRESRNDPVADANLALTLFKDQWQVFTQLALTDPKVLALYHYCLALPESNHGLSRVLALAGAEQASVSRLFDWLKHILHERVCASRFDQVIMQYLLDPAKRMALAYCLAWLRVAGGNSVLPPWVRQQFADVTPILRQLRDIPCQQANCGYCSEMHNAARQLNRYFGFLAFRAQPRSTDGGSLQEQIVTAAMSDQPLFAVLPTGGGKSLCFQVPALTRYQRRGVLTIVISPLQALMKDQVDGLRNKTGAPNVAALYGMLSGPERGAVLDGVRLGDIALLYVSPEQLRNRSFSKAITYREIGCWVFDEAHCLSKWGHDFRSDYLYAARFIKEFSQTQHCLIPPVQCFTATAKEDVKAEIIDHFRRELGQQLLVFEGGVERNNLHFEVQLVNQADKFSRIHALLKERLTEQSGCAVVYCATRANTEEAVEYLLKQDWSVEPFHAGLSAPIKRQTQEDFINGEVQVICATNAFGMGIDKEDVRLVLHADIPGSLENYLQEAGRAGRDRLDADCVLMYDENDIDTQFKLGSFSELKQKDISQILRGLRSAKRNDDGEVVLTAGELLRSERVETSFDHDERSADTKVKTAVSWLERAGFIERNQNFTQVFQGRPRVKDVQEAEQRINKLNLSQREQARWSAIVEVLMNADIDEGLSVDELAELPAFARTAETQPVDTEAVPDNQHVLRTLYAMSEAGLIENSLLLTAYLRYKVRNSSKTLIGKVCALEQAMLHLLPEEAPDAESGEWQNLSLRQLNQRICDEGHESNPETLRLLLQSLSRDGQGLAGKRGSVDLKYMGQDGYRIKLQRDWRALLKTAERRQAVARVILTVLQEKITNDATPSAELLIEFAVEDILERLQRDPQLGAQLKDPLAAVDRGLMFLHEQRVITLQKGLAVFRQAMTIRILPETKVRRYSKGDYEPLSQHYRERVFQVHVMNEYARKGLEKISQALNLVVAYFSLEKAAFVHRYFPDQNEILNRATSRESFQRIVDDLANPIQCAIVAADIDDNMLILAGPGSGKTRVVVHRCAWLLKVKRVRPDTILVLCFNHNAAISLRIRLSELVGRDARGVTVQTYHGLAMRLTGHSLAAGLKQPGETTIDFDGLLREAVDLLQGKTEIPGLDADEVRECLLAGYAYILVDEYQDIDEQQYQLVSAITGRSLAEKDSRLSIMAVGDDDQNIYQFRGANVGFIRRFQADYQAQMHYLVDNYRSTNHIITAANALIAMNRDRMKTGQVIRVNQARASLNDGGQWAHLDPLAQGRVQCLQVQDQAAQVQALQLELTRLCQLDPALVWSQCAVLARSWGPLEPVRALLEVEAIPVNLMSLQAQLPPPWRVREIRNFLQVLQTKSDQLMTADQLMLMLPARQGKTDNLWQRLLISVLADWKQQSGNGEAMIQQAIEFIYESLYEQRQQRILGEGVFLSTVHSAKGMEFDHVFLLDGGWQSSVQALEEERRLYYVAMTRARQTLCLFERNDTHQPYSRMLAGDYLLRRSLQLDNQPAQALSRRYSIWGLAELNLGFAGSYAQSAQVHQVLAATEAGDTLAVEQRGEKIVLLKKGVVIATLSKQAASQWTQPLARIESLTVVAMVWRSCEEGDSQFRARYKVDGWEIPVVEVVYNYGDSLLN